MPESSVTPWTVAQQTPPSVGFPRQEYLSGFQFLHMSWWGPFIYPLLSCPAKNPVFPQWITLLPSAPAAAAVAKSHQSCQTVQPQRWQSTRLLHPWDSPGENTGVGYHFLLQCIKVKSESEVPQSCLTLSDPMDCSLPGSSIHGIFQARVLEWGAIAFSAHLYLFASYSNVSQTAMYLLLQTDFSFF